MEYSRRDSIMEDTLTSKGREEDLITAYLINPPSALPENTGIETLKNRPEQ